MTTPVLSEVVGLTNAAPQSVSFNIPYPNRLTFWLDGLGSSPVVVQIRITGEVYPETVWVSEDNPRGEEVLITDTGPVSSNLVWQSVSTLTIHGLPSGARLRVYGIPFNLDGVPDYIRPYTRWEWRSQAFPRYWVLNGNLLTEMYVRNRWAGFEYAQSYAMDVIPVDVAVEPNTYGLFTASGTTLYYADRRELLPAGLPDTGISVEPLYALLCGNDTSHPGPIRYLHVSAIPGSGAANLAQYRYLLTDPTGRTYALDSNGYLLNYSGGSGWTLGPPATFNTPLALSGSYMITMEMMDQYNTISRDYFPWLNPSFTPLATLDLSPLVPAVKGIAFDSHQRLWVWTGSYAVPIKLHYDAYLLDSPTQTIYLTDFYPQVKINE